MSGGSPGSDSAQRGLEAFNNIEIPGISEQSLDLLGPEYIGDYQAQLQNAIAQGPTAQEQISTDPRLQQAQMNALDEISQIGETGMTPGERAALNETRRASAGEAQAKSAQLMDEFARRGMGGSGAELAARLQAGQSGADRMSRESDALLQQQQAAKLAALQNSANLAGSIRGQSYGEQQNLANAKDVINQFNTQNQQNVQAQNVAAANAAALRNLSEKQRIGEANTGTQNQEQQYNKQLLQQRFQNQIQRAGGQAQQYNNIAAAQQQGAANQGAMYGNLIGAGASLGGAALMSKPSAQPSQQQGFTQSEQNAWLNSDKKAKKNIRPTDMSDFLDDLKAYKYDYKDPAHGQGKQTGVMAQDVEIEEPQIVDHDENGMKHINATKAVGPILASLSDLHERLKQFEHLAPHIKKDS